ncbi:MAG TPA: DinB family protein [Ktedonobacteraceae bacterium]|nr:DinB family protein [Ktedonobacteraceae bacterium]
MDLSQWFQQQLQTSAESFLWAVEQIPQKRLYLPPRPDRWPVARLVYHLACYEQRLALPSMRQWLGGPRPIAGTPEEDEIEENRAWNDGQGHEMPLLLADFKAVRSLQLELLHQVNQQGWHKERDVVWGHFSLTWVVTKTFQHTLEHTDEVLRAYLWWR